MIAVVGYVGVDAPTVMPLRLGDTLVCDASEVAIRTRLTSAKALAAFHRGGVALFTVDGLHAKVIAGTSFSWVGSANASKNSQDNLIEASVRVTGTQATKVIDWAAGLATVDRAIDAGDLRRLLAIKLAPARPSPKANVIPAVVPRDLRRLRFFETEAITTKADEKATESDRPTAQAAARATGLPSSLQSIIWAGGTNVKAGDWVIDIRNGHVRSPGFVVRVGHHQRGDIIWLSPVRAKARPKVAALRSIVPALAAGFGEYTASKRSTIDPVLAQFG